MTSREVEGRERLVDPLGLLRVKPVAPYNLVAAHVARRRSNPFGKSLARKCQRAIVTLFIIVGASTDNRRVSSLGNRRRLPGRSPDYRLDRYPMVPARSARPLGRKCCPTPGDVQGG